MRKLWNFLRNIRKMKKKGKLAVRAVARDTSDAHIYYLVLIFGFII